MKTAPYPFGLLYDADGNPNKIHRALTPEQREAQAEYRAAFPGGAGNGIILPWYDAERRGLSATGETSSPGDQGGDLVGTIVPSIASCFRDRLVLESLGARIVGGLKSDLNLPRSQPGLAGAWYSENGATAEGSELFATLALTPCRVSTYLDVSMQILFQQEKLEQFLHEELVSALAVAVQAAAINGTGSSNQPLGILNTPGIGSVTGGTNGAAPSLGNLTDLEYATTGTAKADRGKCGWFVSPYVRRKLRATPMFGSGSWPIWQGDQAYALLGHPAGVTTASPDNLTKGTSEGVCSSILFGDWSELFIGIWGPGILVEILKSVANSKLGLVTFVATTYVNSGVRTPNAFAAMTDALCA